MLLSLAAPAAARDPLFNLPIDCTLGESCFIQNYVDTDPSDAAADFTCGPLSYEGHKGTDFALPSLRSMEHGVDVIASAPGSVRASRDGVADRAWSRDGGPDVSGIECGNGIVIDHGGGWSTQYCHLKNGSVAVVPGQRVAKGQRLGQVGLSGKTQFPHVHLVIRRDGDVVDPFNADEAITCDGMSPRSLWEDPVEYAPTGLLSLSMSDRVPDYSQIKAGTAHRGSLQAISTALVVSAYAFGGAAGDVVRLSIEGPSETVITQDVVLEKRQAQYFRAIGRRAQSPWPLGTYRASAQIMRNGVVMSTLDTEIQVVP